MPLTKPSVLFFFPITVSIQHDFVLVSGAHFTKYMIVNSFFFLLSILFQSTFHDFPRTGISRTLKTDLDGQPSSTRLLGFLLPVWQGPWGS